MSDWGKGAENNSVGWGQGVANNTVGWGSIYSISYSGDTVIDPTADLLTEDFEVRVTSDSGTFEAEQCLENSLTEIDKL